MNIKLIPRNHSKYNQIYIIINISTPYKVFTNMKYVCLQVFNTGTKNNIYLHEYSWTDRLDF